MHTHTASIADIYKKATQAFIMDDPSAPPYVKTILKKTQAGVDKLVKEYDRQFAQLMGTYGDLIRNFETLRSSLAYITVGKIREDAETALNKLTETTIPNAVKQILDLEANFALRIKNWEFGIASLRPEDIEARYRKRKESEGTISERNKWDLTKEE